MRSKTENLTNEQQRLYGCYTGLVVDLIDPDEERRIRVKIPVISDEEDGIWARLSTLMAGDGRGTFFRPELEDEVLVMFEAGNPRRPVIVGSLWKGQDAPPETLDNSNDNHIKSIVSREKIRIALDDNPEQKTLTLETPTQRVVLQDVASTIEIADGNGNTIRLEPSGITIDAAAKVTINGSIVEIAAGMVTVNAALSKFAGVVQADTLIANSVIASTYTPGAGNVW